MAHDQLVIEFIYQGLSMGTLFVPGQSVMGTMSYELQVGHVYIFDFENELTIHRLLKIDGERLVFKGDFSLLTESISKKNVMAKVESSYNEPLLYLSRLYDKNQPRLLQIFGKLGLLFFSKVIGKPA